MRFAGRPFALQLLCGRVCSRSVAPPQVASYGYLPQSPPELLHQNDRRLGIPTCKKGRICLNYLFTPLSIMSTAERKLHLAKILLETDDEATLQAVEHALAEQHKRLSRYWDIIHALDWSKEGDDAAVLAPAIAQLSQFQEADILNFFDWFAGQLYRLDGRDYAEASVAEDESLSADLFLYARCAVLANGRTFYERVRANPTLFPKGLYFDALLRLPEAAYELRAGQPLPRAPKYIYETGFNVEGWGEENCAFSALSL